MAYCEDYPCCGHTPQDPCERQPYDEPGYFDVRKNPHALCNHEEGECNVEYDEEEPDDVDFTTPEGYDDSPDQGVHRYDGGGTFF